MKRQPLLLRILERISRTTSSDHLVGDIDEEFQRLRTANGFSAHWWLFRQTLGALVYRYRSARLRGPVHPVQRRSSVGTHLEVWLQDLRFGTRLLLRDRLVTVTVVATLSLGVGATATMYSIARGLLRDLPFAAPDEIVSISITDVERDAQNEDVPLPDFDEWRRVQTSMLDIAAMRRQAFHVATGAGAPLRSAGAFVSPWTFGLLGVAPVIGSDFRSADPIESSQVIIGHQLWRDAFDSASDVLGRTLRVDGERFTVIGVMPAGFGFPRAEQLWLPLLTRRPLSDGSMSAEDGMTGGIASISSVAVFGRVAPGFSIESVQSEFASLGRPSMDTRLSSPTNEIVVVSPFTTRFIGDDAPALLYTMLAIVSSVLLIACANVTNLLLARAAVRGREMAVRAALGSTRVRLVRQLITETLVMTVLGSIGGVLCAVVAVRWFNVTVAHRIELFWVSITIDLTVLIFVLLLTWVTALAVGIVPALRASRVDVSSALRDGRGSVSSLRTGGVTRWLVVAEIAVSMVLLVSSGLMVRGVLGLSMRDGGFNTQDVITARVRLGSFDYPDMASLLTFYHRLEQGWGDQYNGELVLTSGLPGQQVARWTFAVEGIPYVRHNELPAASLRFVSQGFFEAFGVSSTSGRSFDERDVMGSVPSAVVNAEFASRYMDGAAVGRRIRIGDLTSEEPWREIVGVIENPGVTVEEGQNVPGIFLPLEQSPLRVLTMAAHYDRSSVENAVARLRDLITTLDVNLPMYETATLERALADEIAPQRTFAILFAVFGGMALLLAAVGLYGTVAFTVQQRQREFGLRRALGAGTAHLVATIARSVGLQIVVGVTIGLALAVAVAPKLTDFTFGANPRDPVVLLVVVVALSVTAVCASIVPTTRAARIDPMQVLREE